jgi:hypothetical protein
MFDERTGHVCREDTHAMCPNNSLSLCLHRAFVAPMKTESQWTVGAVEVSETQSEER